MPLLWRKSSQGVSVMEFWRILAHQHWLTLKFGGRDIKLCARCSGYLVGVITIFVLNYFIVITMFSALSFPHQMFLCLTLITPLIYDWLTQSMKIREGSNRARFITGVVAGIGIYLYQSINFNQNYKVIFFTFIGLTILSLGTFLNSGGFYRQVE